MSKGKKKSVVQISSSARAKSLRIQDAARLVHKNSRTMVKILQLLEASQLPDGSFHVSSLNASERVERLKARVSRRLEVLARWADRSTDERLQMEPKPTVQSMRQQFQLSRSLQQYAPTSASSLKQSIPLSSIPRSVLTSSQGAQGAGAAGSNISQINIIGHQKLFELRRTAVDRFGTAIAQKIMGEDSELGDDADDTSSPRGTGSGNGTAGDTNSMRVALYTDILDDNYRLSNDDAVAAYNELRAIVNANKCQGELPRDKINMYNGLIHKLTGRKSSANSLKLVTLEFKLDSIEMQEKIWALKNGKSFESLVEQLDGDNGDGGGDDDNKNSDAVEFEEFRRQLQVEKNDRQQFIFSNTRVNWGDPNETYKMNGERALEVYNELTQVALTLDRNSCLPREKLYIYNAFLHKLSGKRSCANNLKVSTLHSKLVSPEVQDGIAAIQATLSTS